jgi:hypothetical protein
MIVLIALVTAMMTPTGAAFAAAPIVTPAISGSATGAVGHLCTVVNAGTTPAIVTIEVVDLYSGNAVASTVSSTLQPGAGNIAFASTATTANSYCRVSGISKSKARVTHCALDLSSVCAGTVTVP